MLQNKNTKTKKERFLSYQEAAKRGLDPNSGPLLPHRHEIFGRGAHHRGHGGAESVGGGGDRGGVRRLRRRRAVVPQSASAPLPQLLLPLPAFATATTASTTSAQLLLEAKRSPFENKQTLITSANRRNRGLKRVNVAYKLVFFLLFESN